MEHDGNKRSISTSAEVEYMISIGSKVYTLLTPKGMAIKEKEGRQKSKVQKDQEMQHRKTTPEANSWRLQGLRKTQRNYPRRVWT